MAIINLARMFAVVAHYSSFSRRSQSTLPPVTLIEGVDNIKKDLHTETIFLMTRFPPWHYIFKSIGERHQIKRLITDSKQKSQPCLFIRLGEAQLLQNVESTASASSVTAGKKEDGFHNVLLVYLLFVQPNRFFLASATSQYISYQTKSLEWKHERLWWWYKLRTKPSTQHDYR